MASLLRMPAPAAGVLGAVLLEWSVGEHVPFARSDVLAVIETDKAVIEVEAEAEGVLHRRLVQAGQHVDVGAPIAVIGSAGDSRDEIAALLAQAGADRPGSERARDAGDGRPGIVDPAPSTDSGPPATAGVATDGSVTAGSVLPPADGRRIFASPIARRMANDAGLALAELAGTGPGGRIVRRDVQSAVTARRQRPASAHAAPTAAATVTGASRTYTDVPHSKIRSAIAARLTESTRTVPHFYLRASPRVDDLLALRADLNTGGGPTVSLNDLLVRAVARAHRAVPEMNVTYTETAVRRYDFVDVAIAVATDGGLVTPVIRDADRLSITEIAAASAAAVERARNGRLTQQELDGGSITVTNLGMFGVEEFAAIINPPQSAILAVGATRREPVVSGQEMVAATVIHLVLSVDHRPLDGAVAARWMSALTGLLEHPARILA